MKRGVGYADHILKKLDAAREYVEIPAGGIRIEHKLIGDGVVVWFKDERGNEIAYINIGWDGRSLRAKFEGAKENAEQLAAILNALGAEAVARKYGGKWYVVLTTDSITAIRRPEWLEAVKSLVEALYERGVIGEGKRRELLKELEAGPNVVEVAGVELSVELKEEATKAGKSKWLEVLYQPSSPEAFEAAVDALKAAGFEEDVHFTAKRPEKNERGYVRLKLPAGLWELVRLSRAGVDWAKKTVDRLKEIARERGFSDLLERYLKPAEEAETLDPKTVVAEDPESGVRAAVKDVKREWEDGRPRIVVEYEINGERKSFSFIWGVKTRRIIYAGVNLNDEKALVLAALTGDESLRGKRGVVTLTARHLFALAKYKGIGWDLLRWYAEVMKE